MINKSNEIVNIENETNQTSNEINKQINSIDLDTPQTFLEAVTSVDKDKWIEAISSELENLYNNKTMSLVKKLPEGRKPIEYKWVFTKKYNDKGELEKYKARLVIKGFKQIEGIDYDKTYSPTLSVESMRLVIAIASLHKWNI